MTRGAASPGRHEVRRSAGHGRGADRAAARRRRLGLAAGLLAAVFVTGCATDGQPRPGAGQPQASRTLPDPDRAREPQTLIGAPAEQVLATLGQPSVQRHERPAEVWQYHGRGCVLDVVLYAAAQGRAGPTPVVAGSAGAAQPRGRPASGVQVTVVHVEARDARARAIAPAECLTGATSAQLAS